MIVWPKPTAPLVTSPKTEVAPLATVPAAPVMSPPTEVKKLARGGDSEEEVNSRARQRPSRLSRRSNQSAASIWTHERIWRFSSTCCSWATGWGAPSTGAEAATTARAAARSEERMVVGSRVFFAVGTEHGAAERVRDERGESGKTEGKSARSDEGRAGKRGAVLFDFNRKASVLVRITLCTALTPLLGFHLLRRYAHLLAPFARPAGLLLALGALDLGRASSRRRTQTLLSPSSRPPPARTAPARPSFSFCSPADRPARSTSVLTKIVQRPRSGSRYGVGVGVRRRGGRRAALVPLPAATFELLQLWPSAAGNHTDEELKLAKRSPLSAPLDNALSSRLSSTVPLPGAHEPWPGPTSSSLWLTTTPPRPSAPTVRVSTRHPTSIVSRMRACASTIAT